MFHLPFRRRRGRLPLGVSSLGVLAALCAGLLMISVANCQGDCSAEQQPVITSADPPSGSRNTLFTIFGENLDQTSLITVNQNGNDILATQNITENGITFTLTPQSNGLATVVFQPIQDGCDTVSVELYVLQIAIFVSLEGDMHTVQPGTIVVTQNACLPPACGDNSTSYDVLLDGQALQELQANQFNFVVRLPDTDTDYPEIELFIQTSYSLLMSGASVEFVRSPAITSITPSSGQRGTRVVIEGENLLGYGEGTIVLKEVTVGSSVAQLELTQSNRTHIVARINSGISGSTRITVNTTQTIDSVTIGSVTNDGPYTFSDTLWTQLEDGVVAQIVPPAVQIGGMLSMCGERLLGGGSNIASISIAEQSVDTFGAVEPNPFSALPSECISATVPDVPNPGGGVIGSILIEADTGAIVESLPGVSFTYAVIGIVTPAQGQVGTEVTITGVELLSGYSGLQPTVFFSGIETTVLSANANTVVVRVESPESIGSGNSADIINTPGDIVISVSRDGRMYNVSRADSWTYLAAGEIEQVEPIFGQFGTRIILTGTNLLGYGTDLREALVGNASATVVSANDSVVVIDAPDIQSLGFVDIILESSNGALVSLNDGFEYRERGVITSLSPTSGQNGTFVIISGSNLFGHAENISRVEFGVLEAEVDFSSVSNTQISVRIQSNNVMVDTAVQVVITATTMARVTSSGDDWTYLVPGGVGDVQPSVGQSGTRVTITGTNLLGGGSTVQSILLDGVTAAVNSATPTSITVTMDDISEQIDFYRGTVHIVANTGAVITGGVYNHRVSGMITSIDPRMGREGTRITITGENLLGYGEDINEVLIAGVQGTILTSISDTSIMVRAGAASGGTSGQVTLTSNTGAVITSGSSVVFTFTEPGVITSVTPAEGTEGSGVLIEGSSLIPAGTVVTSVTIGASPVSRIVTESDAEVSVIVGPAPEQIDPNAAIIITADDGSIARGGSFTYLDLTVSLSDLDRGQQGTLVRISLPNDDAFEPSLSLVTRIGGQIAETISADLNDRSLNVSTPRAGEVGKYIADVTVEGTDGRVARLRDGFTFIEEGVIFSVTPSGGQRGTRIQVAGRNLLGGGSVISSARVGERGGNEVSAIVINSDEDIVELEIENNLPAGTSYPLVGDITLVANTGATIIGVEMFTLVQPGQITSVSPTQGQFGTTVTIVGTNLLEGRTQDDINSITLAGSDVIAILDTRTPPSDNQITVQADSSSESAPGRVIITLTTGAQIISPESVIFQYLPPGIIDAVTPNIGTVGTRVVISGENLLGGGLVDEITLGGVTADVIMTPSNFEIVVMAREAVVGSGIVEISIDTGALISGGEWEYEDLGVITSFSPTLGQQGTTVTISGISLLGSSATEFTSCTIAGIAGTMVRSSDNEAMCTVGFNPAAGINTNPSLLSGPIELTANSGPIIVSSAQFTYYVAYIDQIEPDNGTNGTYVTITGRNLIGSIESGDSDIASVTFGGILTLPMSTDIISRDSIRVRVGPSQTATSDNTVRLELTSGVFLELEDAWEYEEPGEIVSIFPESALPGGTVSINGSNIVPPCVSEVTVIVGQTMSYEATVINSSNVTFRLGPYQEAVGSSTNLDDPGTSIPIQVIASNGATVYSDSVLFEYLSNSARVTTITPTAGLGGTVVTIRGTALLSGGTTANRVTLAGLNATILNSSDVELIVIAGDGPIDGTSGRVIIESDNGQVSGIGTDVWQYLPVITAADVSPQIGQAGTRVAIDLRGISLAIIGVFLTGIQANDPVEYSGTVIIVEANPFPAIIVGDIRIEFSGGAELTVPAAWSYLPPTLVTSLIPDRGYFNTEITIRGVNFQAGGRSVESVEVAGIQTDVISQDDTMLEVRVSEFRDSSSGAIQGPVTIVSVDGATYTSDASIRFTYVRLQVSSVTPDVGQGGTVIAIAGVGLLAGTAASQLLQEAQLGGVDIQDVPFHSDTEIQLVASPSLVATVNDDITYSVATGGVVVISDSWNYVDPGMVTDVSPLQGPQGSSVTLRGVGMLQGGSAVSEVMIASVAAMEIVIGLDDLIQVRLGQTTSQPQGTIIIVSDSGARLESTISFQYTLSGTITVVTPDSGQNGTRVTLTGSGFTSFGDVSKVTLAGVEATITGEVTDNLLTVEAGRPDRLAEFDGEVIIETTTGAVITGGQDFIYREEGVIYVVYPPRGLVGTRVVISGERLLGGGDSLDSVYLVGVEAEVDVSNSNDSVITVTVSTPMTAPSTGDVIVISNTGAHVRRIDGWSYLTPGSISNIDPQQGQYGTRIRITGTGLLAGGDSVTQILIGSVMTNDIQMSTDTLVKARAGQPDTTSTFSDTVTIISNFGGEFPSTFTWTYLESSTVSSQTRMSGIGGDIVIINGERLLGGGSSIVSVTTAGVPAISITEMTDNNVVFMVGFHPTGAEDQGDIVIESNTGALTVISNGWTYDRACPVGQYGTFGNCMDCHDECTVCNGPTNEDCLECENFIVPLLDDRMRCVNRCPNVSTLSNVCVDVCNRDQFSQTDTLRDATFCYDCDELCDNQLGCSGQEPTECTACAVARDRDSRACVASCAVGTWMNEARECVPCDSQCNSTAGCFGDSNADCRECRNVRISPENVGSGSGNGEVNTTDMCIEECPSGHYEDSERQCLPCDSECLGGCTGPTPFQCDECASASRPQAGGSVCVSTCNSGQTVRNLYQDIDGQCQECSTRCSLVDGCRGPRDLDCITCRADPKTNVTLPKFGGECVLSCPNTTSSVSPRPTQFYYHNRVTGLCELCHESCNDGCTGPTPEDCTSPDEEMSSAFAAGPGTVGVTVAIIVALVIVLAVAVVFLVCFWTRHARQRRYKLRDERSEEGGIEMENRYTRQPENPAVTSPPKKTSDTAKVSGAKGAEGEYTLMSPTEPVAPTLKKERSASPQHGPVVFVAEQYIEVGASTTGGSGATTIGNVDAELYCEAGAEVLEVPARPAKLDAAAKPAEEKKTKAKSAGKGRKVSGDQGSKPPAIPKKSEPMKKKQEKPVKKPAPPPPVEAEPEMYTEMAPGVQQVSLPPSSGPDEEYSAMSPIPPGTEEYSEMSPIHQGAAVQDQLYEDTATIEQRSPQKSTDDKAPLIDSALYEDTDTTLAGADYQRVKNSASATVLTDRAPEISKQPIPRRRVSQPLPQTPLDISINQNRQPQAIAENMYEAADPIIPVQESLYEAVTSVPGRPLPAEPSPEIPPKSSARTGGNAVPLPPRGKK